ncbi:MAG TPA: phosphatase domain-containing protein [Longimicrobiales bacterium]
MQASFRGGGPPLAFGAGMANRAKKALGRIEKAIDRGKVALKTRLGLWQRPEVQIFRGHGTPTVLRVAGRVVEKTGTHEVGPSVGRLRNALNTFKRMESDELPGVRLRVRACGVELETTTDDEGFFAVDVACDGVQPGWHHVEAEILASPSGHTGIEGTGEVLVVEDDCELGYVSDLDDTVVQTGARNKMTHTRVLLVRDAFEQEPFEGVADLYTLLVRGADGRTPHPIFYLSRSSWGLYDLFVDFMSHRGIPRGPMFLMDAAVIEEKSAAVGREHHKLDVLAEILETHPQLRVVLIGDSGQHDPETYLDAVRRWKSRIRAVWLRDVTDEKRDAEVKRIVAQIEALGVPALATDRSSEMAALAVRLGFIPAGSAATVDR